MAYANGQLPTSSLTQVDGWAFLERRTARAYVAACNKMVRLGFKRPSITAPDGAYRDLAGQRYWKAYWTNLGKPYNAATPGYSNHGWGTAIDIWDVLKWPQVTIRAVFREFGFIFDVPSEAWHARHDGREISDAQMGTTVANSTVKPIIPQEDTLSAEEVKEIKAHITAETNRLADYVRRESRLRIYRNNQQTLADGKANPRFGQMRAMNILTGVDYPIQSEGQFQSLRISGYNYIGDGDFDRPYNVDDQRFVNIIKDCASIRKSLGGSGEIADPKPV